MDPQITVSVHGVINSAAILSIVAFMVRAAYKAGALVERIDGLTESVRTISSFLFRRGSAELVQKGWGEMHSPVQLNVEGLSKVEGFLDKFIPFYGKLVAEHKTEPEIFLAFETEFDDFLIQKICVEHHMALGACIVALMKACEIQTRKVS